MVLEKNEQSKNSYVGQSSIVVGEHELNSLSEEENDDNTDDEELQSSVNKGKASAISKVQTKSSTIKEKSNHSNKSPNERNLTHFLNSVLHLCCSDNKRSLPLSNKSLNEVDENSPAAKHSQNDDGDDDNTDDEELQSSVNKRKASAMSKVQTKSSTIKEKSNHSNKSPNERNLTHFLNSVLHLCCSDNKRSLPLSNKSLNEVDENSPAAKRSKNSDGDDDNTYLRGRIVELQQENKKLSDKIELIETQWMRE